MVSVNSIFQCSCRPQILAFSAFLIDDVFIEGQQSVRSCFDGMDIGHSTASMKYLYAYRGIALPANIVTTIAGIYCWNSDSNFEIRMLAWMKLTTTAVLLLYIHLFGQHILFFFMNVGMSPRRFYASMLAIDMTIFSVVMIVTGFFK
jgi:hypothetical protein